LPSPLKTASSDKKPANAAWSRAFMVAAKARSTLATSSCLPVNIGAAHAGIASAASIAIDIIFIIHLPAAMLIQLHTDCHFSEIGV
jgi:hypothetical protein